jgi:hypothetical protein
MKNLLLIFSFLLFVVNCYTQQFTFNELLLMTNDYKVFELNMIKKNNRPIKQENRIDFSFKTIDGDIGTSDDRPTNDKKYEAKYKFNDGQIYTESEINIKKLDEDYEIRNKLWDRDEGGVINEDEIEGFNYEPSKIVSLIKSERRELTYAHNYNSEYKTATTWYHYESTSYKKVIEQSKLFAPNFKELRIQFVDDNEFSKMLNEIIAVSKYIETKEEYGSFVASYKYGWYTITSEFIDDDRGGFIKIYFEQK